MKQLSTAEQLYGIKSFLRQMGAAQQQLTVLQIREQQLASIGQLPATDDVIAEPATVAGMRAEWVSDSTVPADQEGIILYMHGGAFISGSCETHRDLAARLAGASGLRVLVFEYRLAPEHRFPAANDDCIAAYRWLLEKGHKPEHIVLGGESVGGYLVLATLLALRDAGGPLPAAAFLMSPHTDFVRFDSSTYVTNADADPLGALANSRQCAETYAGESEVSNPILSPVDADLSGFPNLLIQVGADEVLLGECELLAERAREAGVKAELEVWPNMWCAFQMMAGIVPEGAAAIEMAGDFVRKHVHPVPS
ncbi:alpha/beta hydrolase [Paenibacillus kobensis]|uniref:alpha/beta hydrolase n=1 Tax=Paenibacillus kobensis TaxID=59841 RepID=UPI000FDC8259|nr:alpha/beta hydrolase [Paenibacillus kobensis]